MRITWDELAARTAARQFPSEAPTSVTEAADRFGPIQSQTARSAYLGLAARMPGLTYDDVTAAYESGELVRGSTLRGTVHTSTAGQHPLLAAGTRIGQRALWNRLLRLRAHELEEVWAVQREYAAHWRTPAELHDHLAGWLDDIGETDHQLRTQQGRYFAFGQGDLIRRPISGGWETQAAPEYAAFAASSPTEEPVDSIRQLVELHLRCHGPASRNDIAWWSGLGLRAVDAQLATLPLIEYDGPDGRTYLDLPDAPEPAIPAGVRLLPEFDAVLCGYDPKARMRFIDPDHHAHVWNMANGQMLGLMLIDGRVRGSWQAEGTGSKRRFDLRVFDRNRPAATSVRDAVDRAATVMGWQVEGIDVS